MVRKIAAASQRGMVSLVFALIMVSASHGQASGSVQLADTGGQEGRVVYPLAAKAAGREGSVKIKCIVGTDGSVRNVRAVGGPAEFRQAAIDAVSHWHYRPYLENGEPVDVDTTVTVNFKMGDKAQKAKAQAEARAELAKQASAAGTSPSTPQ